MVVEKPKVGGIADVAGMRTGGTLHPAGGVSAEFRSDGNALHGGVIGSRGLARLVAFGQIVCRLLQVVPGKQKHPVCGIGVHIDVRCAGVFQFRILQKRLFLRRKGGFKERRVQPAPHGGGRPVVHGLRTGRIHKRGVGHAVDDLQLAGIQFGVKGLRIQHQIADEQVGIVYLPPLDRFKQEPVDRSGRIAGLILQRELRIRRIVR